jgi:hypothetical protein
MSPQIRTTERGIEVRVCQDGICALGLAADMGDVQTVANRLQASIRREAMQAYAKPLAEWDDPLQ